MKTKLTLLLTALAVTGIASIATAGPDLQEFALRKQIANAHSSAPVADRGPVKYVANPSGKGGTVMQSGSGATSIALFKSKKSANCDACAKR